jgi:hypothetical protein
MSYVTDLELLLRLSLSVSLIYSNEAFKCCFFTKLFGYIPPYSYPNSKLVVRISSITTGIELELFLIIISSLAFKDDYALSMTLNSRLELSELLIASLSSSSNPSPSASPKTSWNSILS